ncbi:MAG: hydroxymethylglutaryl-CoA lyase [Chitinophagaceae bacterium]|nr:hydroxymethylglutaryl-CoA lyase [Chitinophagaceae bacterium]
MSAASTTVKIVECPRDAMQGWSHFIPTKQKIEYINVLLKVGFDTLDFGSFVSPKAIPQMADTHEVIKQLDTSGTSTKLLAIVVNERGAKEALQYDTINCLGFPFSVSETFQLRNANSTIKESLYRVEAIQALCAVHQKQLVIYLSMGFGNPYGDPYSEETVYHWTNIMQQAGITVISLSDTVGLATPEQVNRITAHLVNSFPGMEIGVHLHSAPAQQIPKIDAAFNAGCRRFDGALLGIGGCPMADDELTGNIDTEQLIAYFSKSGYCTQINTEALQQSIGIAKTIFI